MNPEAPLADALPDLDITYDPLEIGLAYGSSGSVLKDMISRSSHKHALYKIDNATVYNLIEQDTRNSNYLTTIKSFENRKSGKGAWLALISSHVGSNQWDGNEYRVIIRSG